MIVKLINPINQLIQKRLNTLSYKRIADRLDNRYNISSANNYDSIFGLIPNNKLETSICSKV